MEVSGLVEKIIKDFSFDSWYGYHLIEHIKMFKKSLDDELDKIIKEGKSRKKEKMFLNILGVLVGAVAVFLCMKWFDWRLLVVIFVAMFGNNLSQLK